MAEMKVDKTWLIKRDLITIDEVIGRGQFGTVHLGVYQRSTVAIKKIHEVANDAQRQAAAKALDREVKALTRVRHPNVVRLIGACTDPPMLIMAYAPNRTLRHVLDKKELSLNERLKLVKGVAKGMCALHATQPYILHLDLKPPNVLIGKDMVPWITDFGLASIMLTSMSAGSTRSGRGTMQVSI